LAFRLQFAYAPSHFIESRAHGTVVGIDDGVIIMKSFRHMSLGIGLSIGAILLFAGGDAAAYDHKPVVYKTVTFPGKSPTTVKVRRGKGVLRVDSRMKHEPFRGGGFGLADPALGEVILQPQTINVDKQLKIWGRGLNQKYQLTHRSPGEEIKVTERYSRRFGSMIRTVIVTVPDVKQIRDLAGPNVYDRIFHPKVDRIQVTRTFLPMQHTAPELVFSSVRKISAKTKRVERSSYPELSKEQIGAVTAAIESIAAEPMYKGLTVHSGLHKAEQATRSLWKTAGE